MANNKRKRSSPPPGQPAQDFPLTSKKKKLLTRPWEHLHMNEGPYIHLWLHVLHNAFNERRARWKKAASFHRVHHQILSDVDRCVVKDRRILNRELGLLWFTRWIRTGVGSDLQSGMGVDLVWKDRSGNDDVLQHLNWTGPQTGVLLALVKTSQNTRITRYKTIEGWKSNISREAEHFRSINPIFEVERYRTLLIALREKYVIIAPRGLNRGEAKKHFFDAFKSQLVNREGK